MERTAAVSARVRRAVEFAFIAYQSKRRPAPTGEKPPAELLQLASQALVEASDDLEKLWIAAKEDDLDGFLFHRSRLAEFLRLVNEPILGAGEDLNSAAATLLSGTPAWAIDPGNVHFAVLDEAVAINCAIWEATKPGELLAAMEGGRNPHYEIKGLKKSWPAIREFLLSIESSIEQVAAIRGLLPRELALALQSEDEGPTDPGDDDHKSDDRDDENRLTTEAKLLALLVQNPSWTLSRFAEEVKLARSAPYRPKYATFMNAYRLNSESSKRDRPSGRKIGGDLEAWDD